MRTLTLSLAALVACLAVAESAPPRDVVRAARDYFDPEEDRGLARLRIRAWMADGNDELLSDMDCLRDFVYQARTFQEPMSSRKWRAEHDVNEYKKRGNRYRVTSETLDLVYSVPRATSLSAANLHRVPRPAPWPVLVSLVDKAAMSAKEASGFALLKQRYPGRDLQKFVESRYAVVPVVPRANFFDAAGEVRGRRILWPLMRVAREAHVDFDRIVLDGGAPALAAAPSYASLFAGLVLRGGALSETARKTVPNFAPVPIYVIGAPHLANQLRAAGHPSVTVGENEGLPAWVEERRRTQPKRFRWTVLGPKQQLAWWINVDYLARGAVEGALDVEVVDTAKAPNTIQIRARGIEQVSVYLNDEIVDLDRPVRIVINDRIVHNKTVARSFDTCFSHAPFQVRDSMRFSFLFTAHVPGLRVAPPKTAKAGK